VLEFGDALFDGARDIESFCPSYARLGREERADAWALIISATAKFESDFQTTRRYREATMGVDPVTGQHVYSEGLLQLSYQDVEAHPQCDEFDWAQDRLLGPLDPRKTIFDPGKNLRCGVRILNRQILTSGLIAHATGYWSTLRPSNRYSKLPQIQAMVRETKLCRR
jgi:hypothetical protein